MARLCVVDRTRRVVEHSTVSRLGDHLQAGDLLVVNSSRTLPAALDGIREDGGAVQVRPWVRHRRSWDVIAVDPLPPHAPLALRPGESIRFPDGFTGRVAARRDDLPSLWRLEHVDGDGFAALLRHGEPIRYSYVPEPVTLEHYQTVYATHPGSAETPSAGRHLSWELLLDLRRRGVDVVDIVLHTGLSSTQDDAVDATRPLVEEWFCVSTAAAAAVASAPRVIAVGTTVVRALESSVGADGRVAATSGWTNLAVTASTRLRACDGLLTGLHEPQASHLDVLRAFAEPQLLERAYAEAVEHRYLWHEFGDAMLLL